MRTEIFINDTRDFNIGRSLSNLPQLKQIGCRLDKHLHRFCQQEKLAA